MQALVLEKARQLSIRDMDVYKELGPRDVRVAIRNVGICGSDVSYYRDGRIGPFIVEQPMILGHEASGIIVETGSNAKGLVAGDRVCMEPGIPDPNSKASRLGRYNLDPKVRFWATPPIHGCLCETVVHPADYTFRLPDNVSLAEGAMVEPLAIGLYAASKAHISPGDFAVVQGAGTIGTMTALSALAGGCSQVVITDVKQPKLDLAESLGAITPINVTQQNVAEVVKEMTNGWGADIVFECSGNEQAFTSVFEALCPGGCVVLVGEPAEKPPFDIVAALIKEAHIETIFRYAHVFPRALALMASGKIDIKPLLTDHFAFEDSIKAFDFALEMPPTSVKVQIELPE